MVFLMNRTEPSPIRTLPPSPSSEYISSVWPNGGFGAWMITVGWSWTSGPLWALTRFPPLFGSDGQPGFGGVHANGTTPTHVASASLDERSPMKTVLERPSVTADSFVCDLR